MLGDALEGDAFDPRYDRSPSPPPKKAVTSGVGAILKGTIKNIRSFGAFVATPAYARECLLHISNISKERVENIEDILKMGQEVWVKVVKEEPDGRVAVSMKDVNQDDGTEVTSLFESYNITRGVGGGVRVPELNTIHHGTVKRIQAFGAFVALDGFDRDGLLHISAISKDKIDKVEDVLSIGDKVWVKVCKVEDGKYSLDMRDVSQRDGTDNDPNNVHKARPSRAAAYKQEAIVLEAVLNVTCARCGGKGHMTHECYNKAGKKYELLEEEEGSAMASLCAGGPHSSASSLASATGANLILSKHNNMPPLNPLDPLHPSKLTLGKAKDKEKNKDKAHSKKRKRHHSDSEGSSSSDNSHRKKKKHHKSKKKHKKHL
ncbi:hypothetical protein Esti_005652 [Eimeria stiedai]